MLSADQDSFFREHMFSNFGDFGSAVKQMVDDFQKLSKSNQNIQSIQDMQRFVENFPEFRQRSGNVSKHVTIISELHRLVDERKLMQVSAAEQASCRAAPVHLSLEQCAESRIFPMQELACNGDRAMAFSMVQEIMEDLNARPFLVYLHAPHSASGHSACVCGAEADTTLRCWLR